MSTKLLRFLTLFSALTGAGATPLIAGSIPVASQAPAAGTVKSAPAPHDAATVGNSFSDADPRVSEAHDLFLDHRVMESLQLFEDVKKRRSLVAITMILRSGLWRSRALRAAFRRA